MGRSLCAALAVLLLWPVVPSAQVNIEKMRRDGVDDGFSVRAGVDLSDRSGNVDLTELGIDANIRFRRGPQSTLLIFKGDYGWQAGTQFSNEGLAHLRYTHGLNATLALETFAQSDYNEARLLDARWLAGAGMRASVVDSERVGLHVGTAYMYEVEDLDLPPEATHPDHTEVSRWSSYLGVRWRVGDHAALSATGYIQPRFDAFEDVRVISSGSLDTKITGALSLTLGYSVRHDSRPPDGIESTDSKLSTGLRVAF